MAASDLFRMLAQSFKSYAFHYRILKSTDVSKKRLNEWMLLSASFTAKFELVFVLTLEHAFA